MSASNTPKTPYEIIEQEKEAYLEELPEPDPDWPADVQMVYRKLCERAFKLYENKAKNILSKCGIKSHDIYGRFRYFTGYGIKEWIIHHRMKLAERLLRYESPSVTQTAMAVGYESCSGFCTTFKRKKGVNPTDIPNGSDV